MLRALASPRFLVRSLPVAIPLLALALLAAAPSATAETVVPPGTHESSETWTLAGSPYVLPGNVIFHRGATTPPPTLTIEPGVVVKVSGQGLKLQGDARLVAVGTVEQPILFTSGRASPAPGDWQGILADGALRLENATIEYAGEGLESALRDSGASEFVVKRCEVRESLGNGIRLSPRAGSGALVEACDVRDNGGHGILVDSGDTYELRGNRVRDNGGTGIVALGHGGPVTGNVIERNALGLRFTQGALPLDNTFADNAREVIEVVSFSTDLHHDARWQRHLDASGAAIPYRVIGHSLGVSSAGSLTIDPGVTIEFSPELSLIVSGGLDARGTAELPLLFTSSATAKAPGQWGGVQVGTSDLSTIRIENFTIEHATTGLANQSPAEIVDCVVRGASRTGVHAMAELTVQSCRVLANGANGIETGSRGLVVRDSLVSGNAGIGVFAGSHDGVLERNRFERNGVPLRMDPNVRVAASNVFSENALSEIQVRPTPVGVVEERRWLRFVDEASGEGLPWHVEGSLGMIPLRASLTIDPGNVLKFGSRSGLAVQAGGALVARGTADARLLFTSDRAEPVPGDWVGVDVRTDRATVRAWIENATIEHAGRPAGEPENYNLGAGAAFFASESGAVLRNCLLEHNRRAIEILGGAKAAVLVEACEIRENEVGVLAQAAARSTIRESVVEGNGVGFVVDAGPLGFLVENNRIANDVNAIDRGTGRWFIPKTPAPSGNIIGGPFFGGNNWSDYPGVDCDGDGLGDTHLPHRTRGFGEDWHPLVAPREDVTPPTSARALDGTAGKNGWWRSAVTVTLEGADDYCGVAAIWYRVDGGAAQRYEAPFAVAGDGPHTVEHWAEDNAGNLEAPHVVDLKIDTTPPTVRIVDPVRGNVYVNDLGVPLVAREACAGTALAPQCAAVPFDALAKECHEELREDACAKLPFDGLFPITVLVGVKTLRADADDATSGVARVTFRTESRDLGTDADAPYSTTWDTTREALARHSIVAEAEDEAGNVAESAPERPITVPLDPATLAAGAAAVAEDAIADAPRGRLQRSK